MRPHTNMLPLDYKTAREAAVRVEPTGHSSPLTSPNSPCSPTLSRTNVPSVTTSPHSNKSSHNQHSHTSQACPANSPVSQTQSLSISPDTIKSAMLRHPDASLLWAGTPSTCTSPQTGTSIPHWPLRGTQLRAHTDKGDGRSALSRVLQPTAHQIGQSTLTKQTPRVILPFRTPQGSKSMDHNSESSKYPTAWSAAEPCGQDSKVWDLQTKTIQESLNALPRSNKRRRLS